MSFYVGQVSEHAVIFNGDGHILLLQHNGAGDPASEHYGKWHMPGGRLDADDQPGAALLREIEEETGLQGVELIMPCHASRWGFDDPVKYSVAYLARVAGRPVPVWPPEEHHMDYAWLPVSEAVKLPLLSGKHAEVITSVAAWGKRLGVVA